MVLPGGREDKETRREHVDSDEYHPLIDCMFMGIYYITVTYNLHMGYEYSFV